MGLLNQWETILKSSTGPPTNQGRWAPNSPLQSFTAPGREAARINSGDGMGWPESNPKKSEVCLMIVFSETHGNMKLGSFQISKWKNLTHHHGEATLRFGKLPWKEVPWKELPWNHLALDNGFFFWIPLHATHHNKWFFFQLHCESFVSRLCPCCCTAVSLHHAILQTLWNHKNGNIAV